MTVGKFPTFQIRKRNGQIRYPSYAMVLGFHAKHSLTKAIQSMNKEEAKASHIDEDPHNSYPPLAFHVHCKGIPCDNEYHKVR